MLLLSSFLIANVFAADCDSFTKGNFSTCSAAVTYSACQALPASNITNCHWCAVQSSTLSVDSWNSKCVPIVPADCTVVNDLAFTYYLTAACPSLPTTAASCDNYWMGVCEAQQTNTSCTDYGAQLLAPAQKCIWCTDSCVPLQTCTARTPTVSSPLGKTDYHADGCPTKNSGAALSVFVGLLASVIALAM